MYHQLTHHHSLFSWFWFNQPLKNMAEQGVETFQVEGRQGFQESKEDGLETFFTKLPGGSLGGNQVGPPVTQTWQKIEELLL